MFVCVCVSVMCLSAYVKQFHIYLLHNKCCDTRRSSVCIPVYYVLCVLCHVYIHIHSASRTPGDENAKVCGNRDADLLQVCWLMIMMMMMMRKIRGGRDGITEHKGRKN